MPLDPPGLTVAPTLPARPSAGSSTRSDKRLHETARQFEAVFMTEMLRQARPPSKPHGPFATGSAEKSWQVFMDQALGDAAVASGGTGLAREIERALGASGPTRRSSPSR
ncbi:conserved protein of unknown function (plasmid) [Rhodovastum atsumiense]|uniref:rod-binding protein n=1 Tax=Rhodovastum atsumiense TaxID=504468 RepID=UPI00202569AE|nr:rod-binding protein [Rhodovastum atsumiense]CAH2605609.1 conserved protein of unknown function [Rhodovastum atsumiense]